MADADSQRQLQPQGPQQQEWRWTRDGCVEISGAERVDTQGFVRGRVDRGRGSRESPARRVGLHDGGHWPEWPPEPLLGRVVDGVAYRLDRLTALGNGQVPRVAAAAWRELTRRARR